MLSNFTGFFLKHILIIIMSTTKTSNKRIWKLAVRDSTIEIAGFEIFIKRAQFLQSLSPPRRRFSAEQEEHRIKRNK